MTMGQSKEESGSGELEGIYVKGEGGSEAHAMAEGHAMTGGSGGQRVTGGQFRADSVMWTVEGRH